MGIARALAADPWGRFGGREGKMARIARMEASEAAARASSALNATLGENGGKQEKEEEEKIAAPSKKKEKKEKKESSSGSGSGSKAREAAKKTTIVIPPIATPEAPATPLYRPPAGWWGHSFFVHAGRLEGISDSKAKEREEEKGGERGFREADQEALAERATALKAAGKRGLGATSSSKKKEKAVGHEWKGSKVVFGDGDDGESGENDGENGDGDGDGDGDRRERKKQKKEKKEKKQKSKEEEAPPEAPSLDVSSLKWKKAAEAALSQGESGSGSGKASKKKGLPVSELAARVAAALFAKGKSAWGTLSKEDLEAALDRSLRSLCESSSRFEVDGKGRVKLAAASAKK